MAEPPRRYVRPSTPITPTPIPSLPPEDHPVWASLVQGLVAHDFSYPAAGMLIFNLNLQWQRDPSKLPALVKQVWAFFLKYHHLLGGDVVKLFSQR